MQANKVTVDISQLNQMIAAAVAEALAGVANQNGRLGNLTAKPKARSQGAGTAKACAAVENSPANQTQRRARAQSRRKAKAGDVQSVIARVKAVGFNPNANMAGAKQDVNGRWHERGGRLMKASRKARLGLVDGIPATETRAA